MKLFRLKEIRENNEDTQQAIADILSVKRGTYASWECGNDTIPTKKIYQFSNYYNKSIDYILNLSNMDKKINCNKEISLIKIGQKLKTIRYELKLSQAKIANEIGINQSTWWGYENAVTLITTSTLNFLSKKYNYSSDWILDRSNKKYIDTK